MPVAELLGELTGCHTIFSTVGHGGPRLHQQFDEGTIAGYDGLKEWGPLPLGGSLHAGAARPAPTR